MRICLGEAYERWTWLKAEAPWKKTPTLAWPLWWYGAQLRQDISSCWIQHPNWQPLWGEAEGYQDPQCFECDCGTGPHPYILLLQNKKGKKWNPLMTRNVNVRARSGGRSEGLFHGFGPAEVWRHRGSHRLRGRRVKAEARCSFIASEDVPLPLRLLMWFSSQTELQPPKQAGTALRRETFTQIWSLNRKQLISTTDLFIGTFATAGRQ